MTCLLFITTSTCSRAEAPKTSEATDGEVDQIPREINGAAASLCSRSPSDRPPAPVNVSVTHLRSDSATVSWEVPEGDIIIGFSILQQVCSSLPLDN